MSMRMQKAKWPSISGQRKVKAETSIEDFEYLLHHIVVDYKGKEVIHHCLVCDHIANMFELAHLTVKAGKAYLNGKSIQDGTFHTIKGLESTQEIAWSNEEAEENKVKPKEMQAGMSLKDKSKEW